MKNKLFCVLLALVLILSMALPAAAAKEMFQIKSVSLQVTAPKAGNYPEFQATVNTEKVYVVTDAPFPFVNGVNWHQYNPDNDLVESNAFQAGLRYKVTVRVRARSSEGGSFLKDSNGVPSITGTINGISATVTPVAGTTDVDLTLQFAALSKELTSASVTDLAAPVAGQALDYTVTMGSTDYKLLDKNDTTFKNGITWYDETDMKYVSTTHKALAGHSYTAEIHIVPTGTNTFSYYAGGMVNGFSVGEVSGGGSEIALLCGFPACSGKTIESVSVSGIDAPVAGQTLDYTATVGSTDYKLMTKTDTNFKNGIIWYDATDMKYVSNTHKALAGHSYTVEVHLVPNGTATFSDSANSYFNGVYNGEVSGGGDEVAVLYSFSACEEKQTAGAPVITLQPQNYLWKSYGYAEYKVKATGKDLTATWYLEFNGTTYNMSDMTNGMEPWEYHAGETYGPMVSNGAFICFFGCIEDELDGAQIYCVVSNSAGQVTSSKALVSVSGKADPPTIEVPASVSGYKGDSVSVTCTASGKGLKYTWYETSTGKLQDIVAVNRGAETSATFKPDTSAVGTRYYVCYVTNSSGGAVYSSVIPVKILEKTTTTAEPEITTKSLKVAVVGKEYSAKLECTDADATFGIWYNPGKSNDFNNTGLTLTQHGEIEGKPLKAGTYTFCVCAAGAGGEAYKELTLKVVQTEEEAATEPSEEETTEATTQETTDGTSGGSRRKRAGEAGGSINILWIILPVAAVIAAGVGVAITVLVLKKRRK